MKILIITMICSVLPIMATQLSAWPDHVCYDFACETGNYPNCYDCCKKYDGFGTGGDIACTAKCLKQKASCA